MERATDRRDVRGGDDGDAQDVGDVPGGEAAVLLGDEDDAVGVLAKLGSMVQ